MRKHMQVKCSLYRVLIIPVDFEGWTSPNWCRNAPRAGGHNAIQLIRVHLLGTLEALHWPLQHVFSHFLIITNTCSSKWGVQNKAKLRTYRECSLHEGCLNLDGLECGLVTIAVEAMQVTCAGHAACNGCHVFFENWFCNHSNCLWKVLQGCSKGKREKKSRTWVML